MEKPPCVKLGKPMNWCAHALREEGIEGRIIRPEEWWKGWRLVKDRIVGPGGITFHRRTLEALWRLGGMRERQRQRSGRAIGTTQSGSRSMSR